MCILSYVKRIAGPGSVHETGCSGLVHWDDPGGWDEEGGGRGVLDAPMADSCMAKTIIIFKVISLQLNKLKKEHSLIFMYVSSQVEKAVCSSEKTTGTVALGNRGSDPAPGSFPAFLCQAR